MVQMAKLEPQDLKYIGIAVLGYTAGIAWPHATIGNVNTVVIGALATLGFLGASYLMNQ